ncbi:hypothetical protein AB0F17_21825 [Nonomuraea sp. NPDC026600]
MQINPLRLSTSPASTISWYSGMIVVWYGTKNPTSSTALMTVLTRLVR